MNIQDDRRILVVDDEPVQLVVLQAMMSRVCEDYQIEGASGGEEALTKFQQDRFGLIVTDLGMAGMDGVALTEAIRELDKEAMVIWITAYGCRQFKEQAERLGVARCLDKPVPLSRIRKVVRETLGMAEEKS